MSVEQASAAEWLAGADNDPEHAFSWWQESPEHTALMPAGRLFDAIVAHQDRAAAALRILSAAPARPPAFADATDFQVYFLIPPGAAQTWSCPDTAALGDATWVWVPAPASDSWIWPPDGSGILHDPVALREALVAAAAQAVAL
jgi:hypothetical protein